MNDTGEYCRRCQGINLGCIDCAEAALGFTQADVDLLLNDVGATGQRYVNERPADEIEAIEAQLKRLAARIATLVPK